MKPGGFVHRLWWHYSDGWPYELPEERKWWVPGWLNDWMGEHELHPLWLWRPYCWLTGHAPERDQCNRPEHDFCIVCSKSLPGRAL